MNEFEQKRKARIDAEYDALRDLSPELFRECVATSTCIVANARLDDRSALKVGAAIEAAMVSLALRLCTP